MRKILAICLALAMLPLMGAFAKSKPDPYKYELSGTGLTPQLRGYIVVKVWNYGKQEVATSDLCLQSAIEGLLFKGYPAAGKDQGKQALVPDGRESNPAYFDEFFSSGKYKQFVQFSNNGNVDPADVTKLSSKEYKYKVGMLVMVNYDALQKQLAKDGIIKDNTKIIKSMYR